ncbi:MAG: YceI family protein [Planctomycetota bacterium]
MPRPSLCVSLCAFIGLAGLAQAVTQPQDPKPAEIKQPDPKPDAKVAPVIKRAESGKSLVVPDDQSKLGTPYHTLSTGAKQITFVSAAHNAKSEGHSAGVIGYAVAGPTDTPAALKAGAWLMPVKSLETGNKTKDKNLTKAEWLDATRFPDLSFVLKEVKDSKIHKETPEGKSFACTLVGTMTMHGVSREITIPDTIIAFLTASTKTAAVAKGDLMSIRCKYIVKLTDYGITNEYVTTSLSVADEIQIDQSLTLSTVPPEKQDPRPEAKSDAKPEAKPEAK